MTTAAAPFRHAADILDPPAFEAKWRELAHEDQLPPGDPWRTFFLTGGRGSGKSWAASHVFREMIETDPLRLSHGPGTWAAVAPTFGDARSKCIESEESGLLAAFGTTRTEVDAGRAGPVQAWNRSIGEMYLRDGTRILIDGADDGAYRIQGENLRGVWADEIGLWKRWKTAWDESIGFAVRIGEAKRVATGTPKRNLPARALVKRLLEDPEVTSRRLLTIDNIDNLSAAFREEVFGRFEGTELGRQELEGVLLDDVEGALWQRDWIERVPRGPAKGYQVVCLGLDPSDGNEDGAEQATVIAGLGMDLKLYVIASHGRRGSTFSWLRWAIREARDQQGILVIEKNHGGQALVELLEQAIEAEGIRVPYRMVWASTGKQTRAEPVAALYEQGASSGDPKVLHIGDHLELEDQLVTWVPGEKSPDRLDALVWAVTELMGYGEGPLHNPAGTDKAVPYGEAKNGSGAVAYR